MTQFEFFTVSLCLCGKNHGVTETRRNKFPLKSAKLSHNDNLRKI
jgi:hypothetical protein